MELKSDILNIKHNLALPSTKQAQDLRQKFSHSPNFTGIQNIADDVVEVGGNAVRKHASSFFDTIKTKAVNFFRRTVTRGVEVKYENCDEIFAALRKNFGSTFDECIDNIDIYNNLARKSRGQSLLGRLLGKQASKGKNDVLSYITDKNENTITFHKSPFVKNVCEGIKEFTVGTILDIGVAARKGLRKLSAKFGRSEVIGSTTRKSSFINQILDKRVAEKKARDAFYKISGIFEQACEGLEELGKDSATKNAEKLAAKRVGLINENIKTLAEDSIKSASKKVGKYNTKSERAWNRLGTGLVSATFAATDFHNISMLQNNDPEKAQASGRKRFMQDMRRQGLTAGITYIILGAFQNKVNKSMLYAVLSLGGVTLISEILSRKMGGIPLTPLSPEKAKEIAEKKEKKKAKEENNAQNPKPAENNSANNETHTLSRESMNFLINSNSNIHLQGKNNEASNNNVFGIFTNQTNTPQNAPSFTSNNEEEKGAKEAGKKKKGTLVSNLPKILLGLVGLSLGVGFLRSRNIFNLDTIIKSVSAKYNDTVNKLTRKRLILPEKQVSGFIEFMHENGFTEQAQKLEGIMEGVKKGNGPKGALKGQSQIVRKFLSKGEIDPNGLYYDMGYIESKGKNTIAKVVLYPINTISRLFKNGNNLIKKIFVREPVKQQAEKLDTKTAVTFIENYSKKFQNAANKGELNAFKEELQDAFTRHFSEANSKNKNTTLAMVSRLLITFITGYFFVNDYRNEVLIESKGQDVERANATAKERVGHKVSNFFLNSMFMDIFNTTFEPLYLSSVLGATGVAMATEFTNETAVRASICTPTKKMNKDELIEYENKRLNDKGIKGKYYRAFMKLTGKKPLSSKAKKN